MTNDGGPGVMVECGDVRFCRRGAERQRGRRRGKWDGGLGWPQRAARRAKIGTDGHRRVLTIAEG